MKHLLKFSIAGVWLLCASCAVTDVDRNFDASRYRTYTWGVSELRSDNPEYKSDLIDKRIKYAVEQEFGKRGIVKVSADADFTVNYKTFTEKRSQSYSNFSRYPMYPYPFRFGYFPYGFGFGMYPYGWGTARQYDYTEGTLILDIIDNKTGDLVWRGSVKGDVERSPNLQKQIRKGVQAILKKYPVPATREELSLPEPPIS
jgi:hypothetical protein